MAPDEHGRDLPGELAHLVEVARTVRVTPGVAKVDEVLLGQEVHQRPGHGEAPEPAVEHPDRPVVHLGTLGRTAVLGWESGRLAARFLDKTAR